MKKFSAFLFSVAVLFSIALPTGLKAAAVTSVLNAVRVYPNPWRVDNHRNLPVKFDNMPASSTIKIFTVSGHQVKDLSADSNGVARWDLTNDSGDRVASGIYIYLVIDPQGSTTSGKIAVIQ